MRFGVGPPLGRTLGLTLTTRATLSHAIRTALKKARVTIKMVYKLIFNLRNQNGLHINEIRTITLSVTLSMIVVNTART